MSPVLDASVFIATLAPSEAHHAAALALYVAVAARHRAPLVTLDRDVVRRIQEAGLGVEVWA